MSEPYGRWDGGPAFPALNLRDDPEAPLVTMGGMSLRDYFAGQALNGILRAHGYVSKEQFQSIASDAYSIASAMLDARGK